VKASKTVKADNRRSVQAAAARPVDRTKVKASFSDKRLLNLKDETDHTTGQDKLAATDEIQAQAGRPSADKPG
jgi:hypothetical protein